MALTLAVIGALVTLLLGGAYLYGYFIDGGREVRDRHRGQRT